MLNNLGYLSNQNMTNASLLTPANPHFFQPLLPGFENHLKVPVKFFSKYIEGKHEGKTVNLISDASERTWKVKREGQTLIDGWKEFVEAHNLRIGDVVIFRHEGDLLFHVTALGPSCCEIQYPPPSCLQNEDEEESDETGESSRQDNEETEFDQSSSDLTCFRQSVTAPNLKKGSLIVPMSFARRNGLNKGRHEIVLMNEEGYSLDSEVKSIMSSKVVIFRNWSRFCTASKLEVGDSFTFRLLPNTQKPVLQLCSREKTDQKKKKKIMLEEDEIVDKTGKLRFVKLTPTPNSLEIGKQHLPVYFTRVNKLNKPTEIILVDKDKLEWPMKLKVDKSTGVMYIMGGNRWGSFCAGNEVSAGESLTLELIQVGGKPLLRFCSKIVEQPPVEAETRGRKRDRFQRWSQEIKPKLATEGEPSCRTRSSNKSAGDQENLQNTQYRLVSDHLAKVKQSLVDTLTCIRQFQAELKRKEQYLEFSLQEINNLEEKITGTKNLVKQ